MPRDLLPVHKGLQELLVAKPALSSMTIIIDFRLFVSGFVLIWTGCATPIQTLEIYNNGQTKLAREYKVTSTGRGKDSITVKLIKYYRNGM